MVRPISDRTWFRPAPARERSRFTAPWSDTLDLLRREFEHLGGRRLVIEIDVREQDLRVDGTLRSNARPPGSDAVVVAFESTHGPLLYRSDLYDAVAWGAKGAAAWQHNVRAVALTLESLRAVDRYGATRSGEQYRGFKQLPPGSGVAPSGMTTELAITIIETEADHFWDDREAGDIVRRAKGFAHPDRNNGDRSRWNAVDEAEQVLRQAGLL